VLASSEDAGHLAKAAAAEGASALGMAGGDGSLGRVAAVALEHDLPFVPVPFGTRNHFARNLGLSPSTIRPARSRHSQGRSVASTSGSSRAWPS